MLKNDPQLRSQFPHGIEPLFSVRGAANSRVFCTSMIDYSPSTKELWIPLEIRKFGEFLAVIFDPLQFRNRVIAAATRSECTYLKDAPVCYFDPYEPRPYPENENDDVFFKRDEYSLEQEYRFAFATDYDPLLLDVGDIRDIGRVVKMNQVVVFDDDT